MICNVSMFVVTEPTPASAWACSSDNSLTPSARCMRRDTNRGRHDARVKLVMMTPKNAIISIKLLVSVEC